MYIIHMSAKQWVVPCYMAVVHTPGGDVELFASTRKEVLTLAIKELASWNC